MTMPNFLLIGAQKSGTTALYEYIQQHPQIFVSEVKEPGFFAVEGQRLDYRGRGDTRHQRYLVTDLGRYQALFRRAKGELAIGEASNLHLYAPQAPGRIRHYLPRVKLLAILRNPIDRAHSAYRFLVRDGYEPLASFEEAVAAEDARIAANWHPDWHYTRLGFYYEQLKRYFDLFDHDQITVFTYDEFVADPSVVVRAIFRFLGVDETFVPDMSQKHNVSGTTRSRLVHSLVWTPNAAKDLARRLLPKSAQRRLYAAIMQRNIVPTRQELTEETRRSLVQLYREDILKLEALLGRDLSMWLQV